MYLPDPVASPDRRRLRWLAGGAVALILLVWLGSLAAEPALLRSNVFRVVAALLAASLAWASYRQSSGWRRGGLPWKRCLVAGVVGSLAVTATTIFAPALGDPTLAGWLASGVAGGAIVILAGFALTGGPRHLVRRGHRRDPESEDSELEGGPRVSGAAHTLLAHTLKTFTPPTRQSSRSGGQPRTSSTQVSSKTVSR
jgi:peptidoglycan/LPS O-acetylase OafA/YrhL